MRLGALFGVAWLGVLEPVRARLHDQILGPLGADSGQLGQFIDREVGQRIAVGNALFGQQTGGFGIHAVEVQKVLGYVLDALLAHDRLGQKGVARTAPELVDRILVERLDLEHFVEWNVGDFLERGEAFQDQDVRDFLVDIKLFDEQSADLVALGLMLLLRLLDAHEVDFPAGQLGGKADVLAAAADGHGQVFLVDHDVHRVLLLVDDDARNLGRRQGIDDELGRIVGIENDIAALAGQFVGHRGHARAAHADAGTLRVEPRIVRLDGNLRAHARIARRGPDLDQPLLDLRHLELEQPHQQIGDDAREDQLRPARLRFDLGHVGAHPVTDANVLLRDELIAGNHPLDAARLDDGTAALDAFDRAGEQVVLALEKIVEDLLALGVADLLQDHLLRGLRPDAPEFDRLERLLDDVEFGRIG